MIFHEEQETEVFANNGGGITIKQDGHECENCGEFCGSVSVSFFDPHRIRAVAHAMLRFADIAETAGSEANHA